MVDSGREDTDVLDYHVAGAIECILGLILRFDSVRQYSLWLRNTASWTIHIPKKSTSFHMNLVYAPVNFDMMSKDPLALRTAELDILVTNASWKYPCGTSIHSSLLICCRQPFRSSDAWKELFDERVLGSPDIHLTG
jgi:hypothetical protein